VWTPFQTFSKKRDSISHLTNITLQKRQVEHAVDFSTPQKRKKHKNNQTAQTPEFCDNFNPLRAAWKKFVKETYEIVDRYVPIPEMLHLDVISGQFTSTTKHPIPELRLMKMWLRDVFAHELKFFGNNYANLRLKSLQTQIIERISSDKNVLTRVISETISLELLENIVWSVIDMK